VICLDDQKLYLACVISGLVFKHHVFSIEGKALLIALTYSWSKGLPSAWMASLLSIFREGKIGQSTEEDRFYRTA